MFESFLFGSRHTLIRRFLLNFTNHSKAELLSMLNFNKKNENWRTEAATLFGFWVMCVQYVRVNISNMNEAPYYDG